MKQEETVTVHIQSILQQHQLLGFSKPKHPLFAILKFEDFPRQVNEKPVRLIFDFYQIILKKECPCKLRYGQTSYDFDEGVMSFFSPRQVNTVGPGDVLPTSGWLLLIHPDFLRGHALDHKIKSYGFFDYAVNEALILSEEEQQAIEYILLQIEKEYRLPIDRFSQDVILSNLDLLMTYGNRFYNRQFITRKPSNDVLLSKVEQLLHGYFNSGKIEEQGLPSVQYLADQLHVTPKYLSDCLKQLTGQTAQQHIHDLMIERAKEILTTSELSIGEIAYQLGFEYPQSFNKLFKNKVKTSPLAYRQSFRK